ncbi:MAG: 3-deoxy-manno-octulosonate cytidylyltransferase [Rhizobiales bacterium]|nr:3-deoxy-manno-octulosonate cytidylyltransferase [Hyphomicrobiales bacterium]MBO6699220.1 3-deoxy-manno-octulosonate cytidylyltransferase [Hyphomicrobiales bacterium]MBO6736758.1 3-deoxy-manno-octulosonate cytidylyltransferase [Hyphomicrobiales bacterium]MBO6912168.1 3-deoxy-manno-octulosonate cytidylyltransferase [Hyphomicrobiales bacterium]MBO6957344.1 3-deoxy-manno-octulosonate cytidylyltransferase [Hyphomicrobiales bacterium]
MSEKLPRSLVLIPARMASTRLPGKPLAMIGEKPMIVHVVDRAREAGLGEPVVATDDADVLRAVEAHGGKAVMTRADHPSGSDRIFEALQTLDPDRQMDLIVNVQGDLPTLDPAIIQKAAMLMEDPAVDIATLTTPITVDHERTDPNVVKVVGTPLSDRHLRALYFTRATAPHGDGPLFHHIGLYVYRRSALERFVGLPPSTLETREKLEQLRALEAGMRIDVAIVDGVPLGVDTPEHLDEARRQLSPSNM